MSDLIERLRDMPVVTVEQVIRFRESVFDELERLTKENEEHIRQINLRNDTIDSLRAELAALKAQSTEPVAVNGYLARSAVHMALQDSYDSLKQKLSEAQRENRELKDEVLRLQLYLDNVADTGLVMKVELEEAKKTLEWLYRWIGHKPLSECVRKVSDTLQAMREGE